MQTTRATQVTDHPVPDHTKAMDMDETDRPMDTETMTDRAEVAAEAGDMVPVIDPVHSSEDWTAAWYTVAMVTVVVVEGQEEGLNREKNQVGDRIIGQAGDKAAVVREEIMD